MSKFGIWLSFLTNVAFVVLSAIWLFSVREELAYNVSDATISSSIDVHDEQEPPLKSNGGHGWQYWLLASIALIAMLVLLAMLGPTMGFIAIIALTFLGICFFTSPELAVVVSLIALLAYNMDK